MATLGPTFDKDGKFISYGFLPEMDCKDYKECKGHGGVKFSHCLECTTGEKETFTVVPSERIDYCSYCKADHGYKCPLLGY